MTRGSLPGRITRSAVTADRRSDQGVSGSRFQGGAIMGAIGDVGKLGVDDSDLKCDYTEAIVDCDQLCRFSAVLAVDGEVQSGVLVGQMDGLACRGPGAGLIRKHPLPIRIAVFVRGLRRRNAARIGVRTAQGSESLLAQDTRTGAGARPDSGHPQARRGSLHLARRRHRLPSLFPLRVGIGIRKIDSVAVRIPIVETTRVFHGVIMIARSMRLEPASPAPAAFFVIDELLLVAPDSPTEG